MRLILRWLLSAISLLIIAQIIPGFAVQSFYAALIAALFLGLVNTFIRQATGNFVEVLAL